MTVLIPNLGSYQHLKPCLESLFAAEKPDFRFQVVIGFNGFDDQAFPRTVQADYPSVRWFWYPNKLGYCKVVNLLLEASTTPYSLILDDDTTLDEGAVSRMVRYMDDHPDVGLAGCRTLNPDGSYQRSYGVMFNLQSELRNVITPSAFWPDRIYKNDTNSHDVDWLNGHYMMVRNDTVAAVGGLDEYYYTFQCEADWCLRIRRAGWRVVYVPEVTVMHVGGQHSINSSFKSYTNLMRSHINRYYFMRKHHGNRAHTLFRAVMFLAAMTRFARFCVIFLVDSNRRAEAQVKLRAYINIAGLSFKRQPEALPHYLQTANDAASACH